MRRPSARGATGREEERSGASFDSRSQRPARAFGSRPPAVATRSPRLRCRRWRSPLPAHRRRSPWSSGTPVSPRRGSPPRTASSPVPGGPPLDTRSAPSGAPGVSPRPRSFRPAAALPPGAGARPTAPASPRFGGVPPPSAPGRAGVAAVTPGGPVSEASSRSRRLPARRRRAPGPAPTDFPPPSAAGAARARLPFPTLPPRAGEARLTSGSGV